MELSCQNNCVDERYWAIVMRLFKVALIKECHRRVSGEQQACGGYTDYFLGLKQGLNRLVPDC